MANNMQNPLRLPQDRDDFIARAVDADDTHVSVGGLAEKIGMFVRTGRARILSSSSRSGDVYVQGVHAVARLVQLTRRQAGQTPEEFAAQHDLELREVVEIESAQATPEPRVLYQFSQVLRVSYDKLLILVGHRQRRDEALEREALAFAAHSGPMDRLSKAESQALQDFIRALSD